MRKNKRIKIQQLPDVTEAISSMPFPPIASEEEKEVIKDFYKNNPELKSHNYKFDPEEPWIQTYSGRRFTPLNPNIDAIVIGDIAHALSMKCRFSGHSYKFYSVAQHCVLASYICDQKDRRHAVLHDASEAYLIDLPSPIKHSGKFDNFIEYENRLQETIYKRFDLSPEEPASVKIADKLLLVTEARDFMSPLHSDWTHPLDPLPFKIEPLSPQDAKDLFMKRFFELFSIDGYDHYLEFKQEK